MCDYNLDDIKQLKLEDLPTSYFAMCVARRRGGKTTLVEDIITRSFTKGLINLCYLFSGTDAGFPMIGKDYRFSDISRLDEIVENYKTMNEYNKIADPPNKFRIKTLVVIDDLVLKLKTKEFAKILAELSVNGRHAAYPPLSLNFIIIGQNLTSFPRILRNNTDLILFNNISSQKELEYLLDENFYLLDSSRAGKKLGRELYNKIVTSKPFIFIAIEAYRQNMRCFADYIKYYCVSKK